LLRKHQFDAMAFFWCRKAGRTVVSNYRQLVLFSKLFKENFAASDERSDHPKVALVDRVVCFHSPQLAVVEAAHDKRLSKVVQMLPHSYNVVLFPAGAVVNHAAFHA
jgi:hypothetical protein